MTGSLIPVRDLTMQDRLLVAAHVQTLANQDPALQVIADTVIECVRCCDYFPECAHVVAESERVDRDNPEPAERAPYEMDTRGENDRSL